MNTLLNFFQKLGAKTLSLLATFGQATFFFIKILLALHPLVEPGFWFPEKSAYGLRLFSIMETFHCKNSLLLVLTFPGNHLDIWGYPYDGAESELLQENLL